MTKLFISGIGAVLSTGIAVPEHEREKRFSFAMDIARGSDDPAQVVTSFTAVRMIVPVAVLASTAVTPSTISPTATTVTEISAIVLDRQVITCI